MEKKQLKRTITALVIVMALTLSGCSMNFPSLPQIGGTQETDIEETEPEGILEEPEAPEEVMPEEEPEPEVIVEEIPTEPAETVTVICTRPDGTDRTKILSDRNFYSNETIAADGELIIRGEVIKQEQESATDATEAVETAEEETEEETEEIRAEFRILYLEWYRDPKPFRIIYSDGSEQVIESPMLHQVVRLTRNVSEIIITPVNAGTDICLCELNAYTFGILPDEVQDWTRMGEGEADICLFPTHADDEYVFFGGLIPLYAGELGYKVQVCWTICHNNTPARPHELLNALWAAGCRYYPEINSPAIDKYCGNYSEALKIYDFEEMEGYEVEMLRKYKPYVVVGHDFNGEYGHGAHIMSAKTLDKAVSDAADPEMYVTSAVKYGTWEIEKAYFHCYQRCICQIDFDRVMENFEGRTLYEVANDCYHYHKSQQGTGFIVYNYGRLDSRRFGLKYSTVGDDHGHDDIMENVSFREKTVFEPTEAMQRSESFTESMVSPDLFAECAEQGTVERVWYSTTDVEMQIAVEKQMLVYLPYGYDDSRQYDVLVLCQGAASDENYWFREETDERGVQVSLKNLLDNMISQGRCEPLIVVSTNWFNAASCSYEKMADFGMKELEISSQQLAVEMRMSILPYIAEHYSTYAQSSIYQDICAAREHFGYVGLSWGAMTCMLGLMRDDTDCIAWFGSLAPGLMNLYDTCQRIDGTSETSPVRYFLMCCGSEDKELPKSQKMYSAMVNGSTSLIDGQNARFVEIGSADHNYGTWMAGLYNSLLVFFA